MHLEFDWWEENGSPAGGGQSQVSESSERAFEMDVIGSGLFSWDKGMSEQSKEMQESSRCLRGRSEWGEKGVDGSWRAVAMDQAAARNSQLNIG